MSLDVNEVVDTLALKVAELSKENAILKAKVNFLRKSIKSSQDSEERAEKEE